MVVDGVIPSAAVLQAERGISSRYSRSRGRSLGPLVKARAFGMTQSRMSIRHIDAWPTEPETELARCEPTSLHRAEFRRAASKQPFYFCSGEMKREWLTGHSEESGLYFHAAHSGY
jgi:hypothetical protein